MKNGSRNSEFRRLSKDIKIVRRLWADFYLSVGDFQAFAQRGKLRRATGKPVERLIGTGRTPLSTGLSSDYSLQDICHFYVARRTPQQGPAQTEHAFYDFYRDVVMEDSVSERGYVQSRTMRKRSLGSGQIDSAKADPNRPPE